MRSLMMQAVRLADMEHAAKPLKAEELMEYLMQAMKESVP